MHDDVIRQLHRQLERCQSPRRQRAALNRWANSQPSIAGMSIDTIIDRCSNDATDQNPIVAALIALHQAGDDDATTVLLTVCIPVVRGVARHAMRSAEGATSAGTHSNTYWAALGHVLATLPPVSPVNADGQPKVFLADIAAEVFASRKQIDASDRRRHRYNRRRDDVRLLALTDEVIDEEHRRRFSTDIHALEDAALDAIELHRIADVIRTGTIDPARWQHLVEHRLGPRGGTTSSERVAVHRTAAKLSRLVDHAAA